jgi:hypothetical protein
LYPDISAILLNLSTDVRCWASPIERFAPWSVACTSELRSDGQGSGFWLLFSAFRSQQMGILAPESTPRGAWLFVLEESWFFISLAAQGNFFRHESRLYSGFASPVRAAKF